MKQARLALAAIAIFAVVGGAVAFKANASKTAFRGAFLYSTAIAGQPAYALLNNATTTDLGGAYKTVTTSYGYLGVRQLTIAQQ
jgi:hypothetical protein